MNEIAAPPLRCLRLLAAGREFVPGADKESNLAPRAHWQIQLRRPSLASIPPGRCQTSNPPSNRSL